MDNIIVLWSAIILSAIGGNYAVRSVLAYLKKKERVGTEATLTTKIVDYGEIALFLATTTFFLGKENGVSFMQGIFFVFMAWMALKFVGYPAINGLNPYAQRSILLIGTFLNAVVGALLGVLLTRFT